MRTILGILLYTDEMKELDMCSPRAENVVNYYWQSREVHNNVR